MLLRVQAMLTIIIVAVYAWEHDWQSVSNMLWADFAGAGYSTTLTDAQVAFVANTYQIVSVEKCFAQSNFTSTEAAVVSMASRYKAANPNVRVLFYYSVTTDYSDCYAAGRVFEQNPEWWLKDDSGKPYGSGTRMEHDTTSLGCTQYWTDAIINVSLASGLLDGVFADGTTGSPYPNMGASRQANVIVGMHAMLNSTRTAIRSHMGPGAQVIGNGLMQYPGNADHGVSALPFIDGVVWEHFLAFEMLDSKNGSLVPALFDEAVQLLANASAMGKIILVKAWPGPCTTPILPLGPSWPNNTQPNTYEGRASAAEEWLQPAMAAFLIVAEPSIWLSYSWWYTAPDGYYPCPDAPDTCSTPANWYPDFERPLGPPSGPAVRTGGWRYQRSFQFAEVHFDAANTSAATITWR